MRKLFILLFGFIPALAFCQQRPVQLNVQSFKTGNHTYTLQIEIEIENGWHAFAFSDTALGIEAFTLSIGNQNILFADNPQEGGNCKTMLLKDPLFNGKSFSVFTKSLLVEKTVEFNANVPTLTITLKGFASDNKKIMPIDIIKEVEIKI